MYKLFYLVVVEQPNPQFTESNIEKTLCLPLRLLIPILLY